MKILFRKTILLALAAALGLASLPLVNVFAADQNDPTTPPQTQLANDRLELVWARQHRIYNRMGHIDRLIDKVQRLIDRAKENGKDVSAVQAALEAFKTQWKAAQPTYESIQGMISSHQGFDESGKVIDTEKARATVMEMREKFKEIRNTLNGTGKALHEAIKAFRAANPRPRSTTTS